MTVEESDRGGGGEKSQNNKEQSNASSVISLSRRSLFLNRSGVSILPLKKFHVKVVSGVFAFGLDALPFLGESSCVLHLHEEI